MLSSFPLNWTGPPLSQADVEHRDVDHLYETFVRANGDAGSSLISIELYCLLQRIEIRRTVGTRFQMLLNCPALGGFHISVEVFADVSVHSFALHCDLASEVMYGSS